MKYIWICIVLLITLVNINRRETTNVLNMYREENYNALYNINTLLPREDTADLPEEKIYMGCKEGWLYFQNRCYKVMGRSLSTQETWQGAQTKCSSLNSNLVSINSQEEQDFVFIYISLIAQMNPWIGLNNIQNESHFTWSDQSTFQYANWGQGEPSGKRYGEENCVEIYHDVDGRWNDVSCKATKPFICESEAVQSMSTPPPDVTKCIEPEGWIKFRNGCYKKFSGDNKLGNTWDEAENICKKHGGNLVTIKDMQDDSFLKTLLRNDNQNMWIGLRNISNRFQWSSGNIFSFVKWSKTPKEPCAARDPDGKWETWDCSEKFHFICEVLPDPVIPKSLGHCPAEPLDWIDLGTDNCYYFPLHKHTTWANGQMDCMLRGGNLISIHIEEELDILRQMTITYPSYRTIAIGLYRDTKGIFKWIDGSPLTFENWGPGEPNDKTEACVDMRSKGRLEWNAINCFENFGYICGINKVFPVQFVDEKIDKGLSDSVILGLVCAFLLLLMLIIITSLYILRPAENDRQVIIASKGHSRGVNPTNDDYL